MKVVFNNIKKKIRNFCASQFIFSMMYFRNQRRERGELDDKEKNKLMMDTVHLLKTTQDELRSMVEMILLSQKGIFKDANCGIKRFLILHLFVTFDNSKKSFYSFVGEISFRRSSTKPITRQTSKNAKH